MHPEDQQVVATPIGKIASVKFLEVLGKSEQDKEESFWQQIFYGSVLIHLSRVPIYFLVFVFSLLILVLPPLFISELLQERSRKKIVNLFKKHSTLDLKEDHEKIFNFFISSGLSGLNEAKKLLPQEDKLSKLAEKYLTLKQDGNIDKHFERLIEVQRAGPRRISSSVWVLHELVEMGVIKFKDEQYEINDISKTILDEFVEFVIIKQS